MVMINGNDAGKGRNAKVRYENKMAGQFPGEALITILSLEGKLTALFPLSSIDEEHHAVYAIIIGEREDSYLVDLPNYTFTSGSKAWFSRELVTVEV